MVMVKKLYCQQCNASLFFAEITDHGVRLRCCQCKKTIQLADSLPKGETNG